MSGTVFACPAKVRTSGGTFAATGHTRGSSGACAAALCCAAVVRGVTVSAATPAARCRNRRRRSFIAVPKVPYNYRLSPRCDQFESLPKTLLVLSFTGLEPKRAFGGFTRLAPRL